MNKFSIDQLRADVDNYIREIMCGTFYHFETSADLDETINFLIAALIGIDAYELMSARHSTLSIISAMLNCGSLIRIQER